VKRSVVAASEGMVLVWPVIPLAHWSPASSATLNIWIKMKSHILFGMLHPRLQQMQ
jgi:hypothetical protein